MPVSYSWDLAAEALSGSVPNPGTYVPPTPIIGRDARRDQFARGIKFANVPGARADFVVHGGPRVQQVNSVPNVYQNPGDRLSETGTYSGDVKFRFRDYRRFPVPNSVNPIEFRSSNRFTDPVFPFTAQYPEGYVFFTIGSGTIVPQGSMAVPRARYAAGRMSDTQAFVAGGANMSGSSLTPLSSSQTYSLTTGLWTTLSNMPTAKSQPAGIVLTGSGDFLVVGGTSGSGRDTVEGVRAYRYVQASGAWFPTVASSSISRREFQMVQIPDGRVFLPGGTGDYVSGSVPNQSATLDANTKALWRCDETSATNNFVDETGVYPLTQVGSPQPRAGKFGGARRFVSTLQYGSGSSNAAARSIFVSGSFTVEFWFYASSSDWNTLGPPSQQLRVIALQGDEGPTEAQNALMSVKFDKSGSVFLINQSGTNNYQFGPGAAATSGTVKLNEWNYFAWRSIFTGALGTWEFYRNGVLIGTRVDRFKPTGGSLASWRLGSIDPNTWLVGLMDDIRITSGARSPEEILATYNAGIGMAVLTSSEFYLTGSNTFSGTAPIPLAPLNREGATTTLLSDGTVLVCGGRDPTTYVPTAHAMRFYPTLQSWSIEPSMSVARYGHSSVFSDGTVVVMGALDPTANSSSLGSTGENAAAIATAESYNPTSRTWLSLPNMPHARSNFGLVGYDRGSRGRVLALGGHSQLSPVADVDVQDLSDNTWFNMTPMLSGVFDVNPVLLNPGNSTGELRILVPGGNLAGAVSTSGSQLYRTSG